eukprot:m.27430 g.27430  ORF g.27430 m.27430 type:complete len:203 (-) comp13948_c0_seq1:51-659(-)
MQYSNNAGFVLGLLAGVGWLVFVSGFGVQRHDEDGSHIHVEATAFCYWGLALVGLPTIIFTQIYAKKRNAVLGSFVLFFSIFMLVCAGGILNETGGRIQTCLDDHNGSKCVFVRPHHSHSSTTMAPTMAPNGTTTYAEFDADNSTTTMAPVTSAAPYEYLEVHPYEQAEFAGAFIFVLFQTIILCIFFGRAHYLQHEGYSTV